MSEFRIKETGEIITDVRRRFTNVSIPEPIKLSDLEYLGLDPILEGAKPVLTQFQFAQRSGPILDSKGNWVWEYVAVDYSQEVIDNMIADKWETIRVERTRLLTISDWTQLTDSPLTAEQKVNWATYRQALRDITTQTDPFNISWPTTPL